MGKRPFPLLILFVVFLAGCGGQHVPNGHIVDPGILIRSGQPDAIGLAALRDRHGIRTVINLNNRTTDEELVRCAALGIAYVPLPISTQNPSDADLATFLRAIRQAEAEGRVPVLVHCQFGEDRTGVTTATYRVVMQGWTADEAIDEMQGYRQWTHRLFIPNLDNKVRAIAADRQAWETRAAEDKPVPLVMPPAMFEAPTTQPAVERQAA